MLRTFLFVLPALVWLCAIVLADVAANGGTCCEIDSPRAVRIGSRRYSCGFPSSTMSYAFNLGATGSDLMTCACSKPQNCSGLAKDEQDYTFVSLLKKKPLALSKVNDEVCDTGDDEPATSACAGDAKSGFYFCSGGIPRLFPLSRVNDGVVDCCDCTDEPSMIKSCDLTECRRQREAMEREDRERKEIIALGLVRLRVIAEETKIKLESMKRESAEQKPKLDALVAAKHAAEARLTTEEGLERTDQTAMKKTGVENLVSALNLLVPNSVDALADLAAEVAIDEGEGTILALKDVTDINGEETEQMLKAVAQDFSSPRESRIQTLAQILKSRGVKRESVWRVLLSRNDGASHRKVVDLAKACSGAVSREDIDASIHAAQAKIDEYYQRPQAAEARAQVNEATRKESEFREKLSESEKILKLDLGVNGTLLHLAGKEFTKQSGEYEFKFRAFEKCEQGTTDLGKFTSWGPAIEGQIPQEISEGKGVPKPTMVMNFENGLRCYQGTIRSTKVYLRCGADDAITKIVEPEVCRYVFLFTTPVACVDEKEVLIATETLLASVWRRARSILPW